MIKVYNGDAYGVQEEAYDRSASLCFFLDGHRDEYILIYRGEQVIKVLSYYDVLYNREVPEKVLYLNPHVFEEARKLFFSYEKQDERWHRAVAVCGSPDGDGTPGDVECILYYQQNLTDKNYMVSEFEEYAFEEDLDFELLSRADAYVFEEFEEYTAFICEVLERKFPQKEKIFLDENIEVFSRFYDRCQLERDAGGGEEMCAVSCGDQRDGHSSDQCCGQCDGHGSDQCCGQCDGHGSGQCGDQREEHGSDRCGDQREGHGSDQCGNQREGSGSDRCGRICDRLRRSGRNVFYITSEREKDFFGQRFRKDTYSSMDLMTALFWQKKEACYGEMNPDKKFLLIRFPVYSSGLGDVIRFCMTKVAMVEYRNLDYIPVIDLSIPGDKNSFNGGRTENVWENFFEPLNEYRGEEVLQSRHVLLCDDKMDAFNPYMMEQYYNAGHMRAIYKKYLRLNVELKNYVDSLRGHFFQGGKKKVLGGVSRGTDYKYGGFDVPQPIEDEAYIELIREKMEEWGCDSLLLATEDADVLEKFKQAGFGDRMQYLEQERFRYPDTSQKGLLVAKMKKEGHDYHDEMPYVAVLYLLAECDSLISNCRCGAFEVADFINGGAYEHRYCCREGDVK